MITHASARHGTQRAESGATLAAVLVLLAAGTLLGISALRSAAMEAQLSSTLWAAQNAFWLAETGIAAGINFALTRPAELPRDAAMNIAVALAGPGRVETAIYPAGEDARCPADAIRHHWEIHATGYGEHGAISTHVQGFYICGEVCTTPDCVLQEYPLVRSYWKGITGGIPP